MHCSFLGPKVICREHEDPNFDPTTGRTRRTVQQVQPPSYAANNNHAPVVAVPQFYGNPAAAPHYPPPAPQPQGRGAWSPGDWSSVSPYAGASQAQGGTVGYSASPSAPVQYGGQDPALNKHDYPPIDHGQSSNAVPPAQYLHQPSPMATPPNDEHGTALASWSV